MTHFQGFAKQLAVGNLSITFPLILKDILLSNNIKSGRSWRFFEHVMG